MKEHREVIITKTESILLKIFCNKCGKSTTGELKSMPEMLEIDKTWGYHSNMDGHKYEFDICQPCFIELIKSFKIPPKLTTGNLEMV